MTEVDVEDALASDDHQDEAEEEPSDETGCKVFVLSSTVSVDIAHGKDIELHVAFSTGRVNREQTVRSEISRWFSKCGRALRGVTTYIGQVMQAPKNIMTTNIRRNRRKRYASRD